MDVADVREEVVLDLVCEATAVPVQEATLVPKLQVVLSWWLMGSSSMIPLLHGHVIVVLHHVGGLEDHAEGDPPLRSA